MKANGFFYSALQAQVLETCDIEALDKADCKEISIRIFVKDRNYVSETTIKKIFGLLENTAPPSPFVLDSLARFTGYTDWEDFKKQIRQMKDNQFIHIKTYHSKFTVPPAAVVPMANKSSI